jgi:Fungal specific transcription factor domain
LESLVQSLGAQVQTDDGSTPPGDKIDKEGESPSVAREETHEEKVARVMKEFKEIKKARREEHEKSQPNDPNALSSRFGKLIVHEARSRYITPGLWSNLKAELQDISTDKELLNDSESDVDDYPTPDTSTTSATQPAFLFGMNSTNVDMTQLHPPPEHVPVYWQIYKDNVDVLFKTIHVPSREPVILANASHLDSLNREQECSMFSIYFAAITSLKPDECKYRFGESKTDLLARYRFGVEQSLARAEFLKTDSAIVLCAFITFLVCLRTIENGRVVWSLTSLAVRIAQSLGLHRDGGHYPQLSPWKQEMRRRLWWHTVVLDLRASEDLGSDPSVYDMMADTELPRNLNDSDIPMDMKELPESRVGITEITFSLIRFEISRPLRHLAFTPPGGRCPMGKEDKEGKEGKGGKGVHGHGHGHGHGHFFMPFEKKKQKLEELEKKIEEQYLKNIDYTNPLHWLTATSARLILSKMKLVCLQLDMKLLKLKLIDVVRSVST